MLFRSMKNNPVPEAGFGVTQLDIDDFFQVGRPVNVQIIRPPLQVHGRDQSHQAEIMIAVQVGDKNMIDPVKFNLVPVHLNERTFSAIYQKKPLVDIDHLSGWMSLVDRGRGAAAENADFKIHQLPETIILRVMDSFPYVTV